MKILGVTGARPNFMKIDPVWRILRREPDRFSTMLVHTGQHYDEKMAQVFFRDLGLALPEIDLGVGSGSHAAQTAAVMVAMEKVLLDYKPDLLLVVGDVNSTVAAALCAAKLHVPVAHVEAGLRSFDRRMPEEINRLVTDTLSTHLFTPSRDADENLRREGIADERIHFVGNVMIDTLLRCVELASHAPILKTFEPVRNGFAVLTLHRPSNVDDRHVLAEILDAVGEIQRQIPVVFPIHPRTLSKIKEFGMQPRLDAMEELHLLEPLGYLDFLALQSHAKVVLTDSGGVQEETTVLGVPCITLRDNTERPLTVTSGSNHIVGHDKNCIVAAFKASLDYRQVKTRVPEYWDGHAADRIVDVLRKLSR